MKGLAARRLTTYLARSVLVSTLAAWAVLLGFVTMIDFVAVEPAYTCGRVDVQLLGLNDLHGSLEPPDDQVRTAAGMAQGMIFQKMNAFAFPNPQNFNIGRAETRVS